MLEPQAENPWVLRDFHRRQAALNIEAGDFEASSWHGVQAQKAAAQIRGLCETCKGTGQVKFIPPRTVDCHPCRGTGKAQGKDPSCPLMGVL